jgi:hypothetical protein
MLPWQFFATALSSCSDSLITNANLLTKVYFPRLIVPAAAVITSFVDFLISFVILTGLMVWFQWWPSWRLLTIPLWVAIAFGASMGAGLWLASLNVQYRDFRYVVPFLVQFGLYVSPVGFSSAIVPEKWQLLYALNPMVGVIEGSRWAIIGKGAIINPTGFWLSIAIVALLAITGVRQFRRMARAGTLLSADLVLATEFMLIEVAHSLWRLQRDLGMVRATPHMVSERAFSTRFPAHSPTGSPQPERAVQPPAAIQAAALFLPASDRNLEHRPLVLPRLPERP